MAAALKSAKHSLAYRISSEAPFRLAPCGQDTDCQLLLREGFAGEKVLSRSHDTMIRVFDEAGKGIENA